jgi:hypothetical protein
VAQPGGEAEALGHAAALRLQLKAASKVTEFHEDACEIDVGDHADR